MDNTRLCKSSIINLQYGTVGVYYTHQNAVSGERIKNIFRYSWDHRESNYLRFKILNVISYTLCYTHRFCLHKTTGNRRRTLPPLPRVPERSGSCQSRWVSAAGTSDTSSPVARPLSRTGNRRRDRRECARGTPPFPGTRDSRWPNRSSRACRPRRLQMQYQTRSRWQYENRYARVRERLTVLFGYFPFGIGFLVGVRIRRWGGVVRSARIRPRGFVWSEAQRTKCISFSKTKEQLWHFRALVNDKPHLSPGPPPTIRIRTVLSGPRP